MPPASSVVIGGDPAGPWTPVALVRSEVAALVRAYHPGLADDVEA